MPDRDPRLPFDEARLGSDPGQKDTDGDGLADLLEVMAGTFHGADPRRPDTDGDGVKDGADLEPLLAGFSTARAVKAGAVILDGKLDAGEWQEIGVIAAPQARIFARWTRANLSFAIEAARPLKAFFEVDAAGDGWFLEDDNLVLELDLDGTASPRAQGPAVRTAGSRAGDRLTAELSLPLTAVPRLQPAPARFGLCVRVAYREGEGDAGWDRELFLGEPWALIDLELGERP